jgi:hypothetical protein
MGLLAEMAAPPIGSIIMLKSTPLTAWGASTVVEFGAIFILLLIPETLKRTTRTYEILSDDSGRNELGDYEDIEEELEATRGFHTHSLSRKMSEIRTRASNLWIPFKAVAQLAAHDRNILFSLPAFLVATMGRELIYLLLQYASARYGWTLAEVHYLIP